MTTAVPAVPSVGNLLRPRSLGHELQLSSTLATFGTALDITVAELAIESLFPADAATEAALRESFR